MCAPVAIAYGIAMVVAATAAGYTASEQASAQKESYDYQAAVNRNNAITAQRARADALRRGEIEAQKQMLQQSQLRQRQAAQLASNGLDLGTGSAVDLLATTDYLGKRDTSTIMSNAAREAWGYNVQASNYTANANLLQSSADNINPAATGAMTGVTSLLSSAASAYAGGMFKGGGGMVPGPMDLSTKN